MFGDTCFSIVCMSCDRRWTNAAIDVCPRCGSMDVMIDDTPPEVTSDQCAWDEGHFEGGFAQLPSNNERGD